MLARCLACVLLSTTSLLGSQISLVRVGDTWSYLPAVTEAPPPDDSWLAPGFNDRQWSTGRSGFSLGYLSPEATVLPNTPTAYNAVYFRCAFPVRNPTDLNRQQATELRRALCRTLKHGLLRRSIRSMRNVRYEGEQSDFGSRNSDLVQISGTRNSELSLALLAVKR
jgi:hypothetical protein